MKTIKEYMFMVPWLILVLSMTVMNLVKSPFDLPNMDEEEIIVKDVLGAVAVTLGIIAVTYLISKIENGVNRIVRWIKTGKWVCDS